MKKPVLWIIAGTTEGRELINKLRLSKAEIYISVATDYGRALITPKENLHVKTKRLSLEEMVDFIHAVKPDCVIDTTHPYAQIVTKNILEACKQTSTGYIRLQRMSKVSGVLSKSSIIEMHEGTIFVESTRDAARILNNTTGSIFLTCGSKEIEVFTGIRNYRERVFARVLPTPDVMKKCEQLGFKISNISYMQGPFSKELNLAMLKSAQARYLVTKDSGEAGGFQEKIEAANELGITVVLITRPELRENPAEKADIADLVNLTNQTQPAPLIHRTVYSQEQVLQELIQNYFLEWCREEQQENLQLNIDEILE